MIPDLLRAAADVLVLPPDLSPSEWAERHRVLSPAESEFPGPWSNAHIPALASCMDAAQEAIERRLLGVVMPKPAQMGGSEVVLNVLAWAAGELPGSSLYITSTDDVAGEVAIKRLTPLIAGCKPLREAQLTGRGTRERMHIFRFPRGKWVVGGSQCVTKLESEAFRVVVLDEVDRMPLYGGADPIATARTRTQSYRGATLVYVLGHPTTADRGGGQLYYDESDQRRPHVECPLCGEWIWLDWDTQVYVEPRAGEAHERARRNPARYRWRVTCCGGELTDALRWRAIRHVEQRSVIAPELAETRRWIGVHPGGLWYVPGKELEELAAEEVAGLDSPSAMRVWVNKGKGDVYRVSSEVATEDDWRRAVVRARGEGDPDVYRRGEVPAWVQILTAGTDHRATEQHWAVWGWGLVLDANGWRQWCGALIDHGTLRRVASNTLSASDLAPLDALVYDRAFPRAGGGELFVRLGVHDSGWQSPAIYEYCLRRLQRGARGSARPSKGASLEPTSVDTAPIWSWTSAPTWDRGGRQVTDRRMRVLRINTHIVKEWLSAKVRERFVRASDGREQSVLVLPADVGDEFVKQSGNERLEPKDATGSVLVWRGRVNHYGDCNVGCAAAARAIEIAAGARTRGERREQTATGPGRAGERDERVGGPDPRQRFGARRKRGWFGGGGGDRKFTWK